MSVRLESGEFLQITSSPLDHNAVYTMGGYVYLVSDRNDYSHIVALLDNSSPDYVNADFLGTDNDGTTLRSGSYFDPTFNDGVNDALSTGTWYHVALVRSSTTALKCLLNGSTVRTHTTNVGSRAATTRLYLGMLNAVYGLNARVAAWKAWSAALSDAQVQDEMDFYDPVITSNLYAWWPLQDHTDLEDKSGSAHHWSVGSGTLSTEDDPPGVTYQGGGGSIVIPVVQHHRQRNF